jgi:hypothetical protein
MDKFLALVLGRCKHSGTCLRQHIIVLLVVIIVDIDAFHGSNTSGGLALIFFT